MANIKISELTELTKSQTAYDDYIPVVDSSASETKKISVESLTANNIYLLAVVKPNGQVPTPETGAKYYNESTNKIYYAPDDEHWYEYGTPIEGIFYVVLGEKGNYTYDADNEILVSVGGGSGSEIVIGDESETTEDTKLLVDTSGSTDELKYKDENTGTFKDLEVKALDSMPVGTIVDFDGTNIPTGWEEVSEWKSLATNISSNTNVNLPDDFDELFVEINMIPSGGSSTNYTCCTIPKIIFDTLSSNDKKVYRVGGSYTSSYYFGVSINAFKTYTSFTDAYIGGTDITNYAKMNVYYR